MTVNKGKVFMKEEKMTNRQVKALETKKRIYASAEILFRQQGFEAVSIDAIVEHAGVSKGAFYVHFPSKNALISAQITDYVGNLDSDYLSYYRSIPAGTPAGDILLGVAGKITDIMISKIGHDLMKMTYGSLLSRKDDTVPIWGYGRDLYQLFEDIITRGIEQGEFRQDLAVDLVGKHCVLAMRGATYEWCIRYPDYDLQKEIQEHFQLLLDGIKVTDK